MAELNLSDFQGSNIEKSFLTNIDLIKGGRAAIGEIREFGGRKYIKTTDKVNPWKFYGGGAGMKAKAHAEKHGGHESTAVERVEHATENIRHAKLTQGIKQHQKDGNHYRAAHIFSKMDPSNNITRNTALDAGLRENYGILKLAKKAVHPDATDEDIDAADEAIRAKHGDVVADNFGDSIGLSHLSRGKEVANFLDEQVRSNPVEKKESKKQHTAHLDVLNQYSTRPGNYDSIGVSRHDHPEILKKLAAAGYHPTMNGFEDSEGEVSQFKNNYTGHSFHLQKLNHDIEDRALISKDGEDYSSLNNSI